MKIIREENFDPETFPWSKSAAKVVKIIKSANKIKELEKYLQKRFWGNDLYADMVDLIVRQRPEEVLDALGLDKNGRKKKTKKFEVFFRIEGVINEEVEAETPEEAARKAYADLNEGDPIISIIRSDVDSMKPVAYNDENGNTKDYPEDFGGDWGW